MALLRRPMPKKAAQARAVCGILRPRSGMTAFRINAASPTRRRTRVSGGRAESATRVKKNDPPQSTERLSSIAHSDADIVRFTGGGMADLSRVRFVLRSRPGDALPVSCSPILCKLPLAKRPQLSRWAKRAAKLFQDRAWAIFLNRKNDCAGLLLPTQINITAISCPHGHRSMRFDRFLCVTCCVLCRPTGRIIASAVVRIGGKRLPGLKIQPINFGCLLDFDCSGLNSIPECLSIFRGPTGSGQIPLGKQIVFKKISVRHGWIAVRSTGFPLGLRCRLVSCSWLQCTINIWSFARSGRGLRLVGRPGLTSIAAMLCSSLLS